MVLMQHIPGPEFYEQAVLPFYKALKVYPAPLELIMIYQKTVPEPVFQTVVQIMALEVRKKKPCKSWRGRILMFYSIANQASSQVLWRFPSQGYSCAFGWIACWWDPWRQTHCASWSCCQWGFGRRSSHLHWISSCFRSLPIIRGLYPAMWQGSRYM